jgi:hypothetical protein
MPVPFLDANLAYLTPPAGAAVQRLYTAATSAVAGQGLPWKAQSESLGRLPADRVLRRVQRALSTPARRDSLCII